MSTHGKATSKAVSIDPSLAALLSVATEEDKSSFFDGLKIKIAKKIFDENRNTNLEALFAALQEHWEVLKEINLSAIIDEGGEEKKPKKLNIPCPFPGCKNKGIGPYYKWFCDQHKGLPDDEKARYSAKAKEEKKKVKEAERKEAKKNKMLDTMKKVGIHVGADS